MKNPILLLISCLIYSVGYSQTNINYSSFDAWRQSPSTKKMEHIKTIYESGYIELDNKKATAIIYNSKTNQKELFQFTPFRKVANDHFIGFGKFDRQQMLTFIPEDRLLLLKINDIVVMQFSLKQSDIFKLKKEFESNFVNDNTDYNGAKVSSKNKVDLLVNKYHDNEIKIFTSEGELIGYPIIKKNSDGKPYSIKINGSKIENADKISEFFASLFNDKAKEGFKTNASLLSLRRPPYYKESLRKIMDNPHLDDFKYGFQVEFYKDNYSFKARVQREEDYYSDQGIIRKRYFYDFSIELVDMARLGGSKSKSFKF